MQSQNIKKILMFDLSDVLLARYPRWLATNLRAGSFEITFMGADTPDNLETLANSEWLRQFDVLVVFGHRIPDLILGFIAKRHNLKVLYFQHGTFKARLERSFFSLGQVVRKKGLIYLKFIDMFLKHESPSKWLSGLYRLGCSASIDNQFCAAFVAYHWESSFDAAFVFTEYDKPIINKILGPTVPMIAIGAPDVSRFVPQVSNGVAVIFAQTLVEDGRLSLTKYIAALIEVVNKIRDEGFKPKVFLHQRSDLSIYRSAGIEYLCIKNQWPIPPAQLYLSDYSSLLLTAASLGLSVARVDFSSHKLPQGFDAIPVFPEILTPPQPKAESSPSSQRQIAEAINSVLGTGDSSVAH